MERVAVIGLGAVGSVVAAALANAGAEVIAVSRSRQGCGSVRVSVRGFAGEAPLLVCGWDAIPRDRPGIVLVAVKAYDLPSVVSLMDELAWLPDLIVSLQNGLGSLELLEEAFGSGRTAAGVVYFGATRVSSTIVELRGHGSLILGCRRPPCSRLLGALADLLSKGGLSVRLVGSIEPYRWLKLIVNAAINPVTAIACKPNRVILEDDSARNLALALAREAFYVSKLVGVRLPTSNVEAEVVKAARATADNYSSMLQDIIRGRPTEIDYINGAVVHAARRKGASAPVNEAVVLSVKLLESRGSCRMEFPLKDS